MDNGIGQWALAVTAAAAVNLGLALLLMAGTPPPAAWSVHPLAPSGTPTSHELAGCSAAGAHG